MKNAYFKCFFKTLPRCSKFPLSVKTQRVRAEDRPRLALHRPPPLRRVLCILKTQTTYIVKPSYLVAFFKQDIRSAKI